MSTTTTPLLDPQQPPPIADIRQIYPSSHSGHGSVGPVIAALAVITILGAIAVMIGRLCSGRRIMGHPQYYDFEGWVETKFSSCIDGRIDLPPPRPPAEAENSGGDTVQPTVPAGETECEVDTNKRPEC
ncbi:hypothetical protein LguiA_027426 [Lonicera macranthoides]